LLRQLDKELHDLEQMGDLNDDGEHSNDKDVDAADNSEHSNDKDVDAAASDHSDLQDDDDLSVEDGDGGDLGTWNFLHNFPVSVQIDSVDQDLLDQAREEVPIVLNRIRRKIFGRRRRAKKPNTITPSQFLEAWMDANLLGHMKSFINQNLMGDPVSSSDIIAFVRVELMLSFYSVSPNLYFDPVERSNFPSAGQGMNLKRYKEILAGLSSSPSTDGTNRRQHSHTITSSWTAPRQHDRYIAAAMDIVR
jgi:hypothetical protein